MLTAYKQKIFADATSLVVFSGPPHRVVEWSVADGPGSIEALSDATDEFGKAAAVYRPLGSTGTATVRVTYGA